MWEFLKTALSTVCSFPLWIKTLILGGAGSLFLFRWLWPKRSAATTSPATPAVTREGAEDRKSEIKADLEAALNQIRKEDEAEKKRVTDIIMGNKK